MTADRSGVRLRSGRAPVPPAALTTPYRLAPRLALRASGRGRVRARRRGSRDGVAHPRAATVPRSPRPAPGLGAVRRTLHRDREAAAPRPGRGGEVGMRRARATVGAMPSRRAGPGSSRRRNGPNGGPPIRPLRGGPARRGRGPEGRPTAAAPLQAERRAGEGRRCGPALVPWAPTSATGRRPRLSPTPAARDPEATRGAERGHRAPVARFEAGLAQAGASGRPRNDRTGWSSARALGALPGASRWRAAWNGETPPPAPRSRAARAPRGRGRTGRRAAPLPSPPPAIRA